MSNDDILQRKVTQCETKQISCVQQRCRYVFVCIYPSHDLVLSQTVDHCSRLVLYAK